MEGSVEKKLPASQKGDTVLGHPTKARVTNEKGKREIFKTALLEEFFF